MGSTEAKAYLASPEVVAASALQGKIAGPGRYQQPAGWAGVEMSEGEQFEEKSVDEVLGGVITKLESIVHSSSHLSSAEGVAEESKDNHLTELYPGFPEKIKGELVFCDADTLNTDGIYPVILTIICLEIKLTYYRENVYYIINFEGYKLTLIDTYQDYVPTEKMAEVGHKFLNKEAL
jgi:aconitase A